MNYSDHKNNLVSNSFSVTQCKTPVKRAKQWIRNLELGPAIPSSCGFPSFLALDGTQPWFSDLHPNLVSAQSCTWFTAPNPMLNLSPYNLCPISSSLLIFRSHWNPLPYLWVLKNQCLSAYLTTNLIHPHGSSGTYPQSCSQSSILVTGFPSWKTSSRLEGSGSGTSCRAAAASSSRTWVCQWRLWRSQARRFSQDVGLSTEPSMALVQTSGPPTSAMLFWEL